jgi:phosphoribosylaminoimidazolecarboxamide formyltransferase/IMP cyclohydrolase
MSEPNQQGLRNIRRALLSVSDKTGLVEFARALGRFGVELLSTGGTAKALREAGIEVRDVSEVTGFPEMLDGRVKTLHPRVHGGLLAVRDNREHMSALGEHGIEPIDLVVINLYPFQQTIAREGTTLAEAIEQIDIGGPAMVRSAAKNYTDVAVVTSPAMYERVLSEMEAHAGALTLKTRAYFAAQAFGSTAHYDVAIWAYLQRSGFGDETKSTLRANSSGGIGAGATGYPEVPVGSLEDLPDPPDLAQWSLRKAADLRYGENPHQSAAIYATGARGGVGAAELLSGKEMSYNNSSAITTRRPARSSSTRIRRASARARRRKSLTGSPLPPILSRPSAASSLSTGRLTRRQRAR